MPKLFLLTFLFVASLAHANPHQPTATAEGTPSRALQQAKRVATMENEGDVPSRAVWLGQRVARSAKLASLESRKRPKATKPRK